HLALAGFRPSDVDAVGLRPSPVPAQRGVLAFSLLSNEGGYLDGDVLAFGSTGSLDVLIPEATLAAALGLSEASLDVDGLDYDEAGRLCFSLQGSLVGTTVGDVDNGDVLRLEPDGSVTRLFTEADVQAALTAATGLTDAVGDVHAVALSGGETWVAVQAPSAVDGTLLRLGDQPVLAMDELVAGLGGSELDAAVVLPASYRRGSLAVDVDQTVPGAMLTGFGAGFEPLAPVAILVAGTQAASLDLGLGGFGDLLLDLGDPWFAMGGFPVLQADASGRFQVGFQLPPGNFGGLWQGTWGWTFQALDLVRVELSAPIRVQL
ncbi:MAG: hypothetical protein P1V81_16295, partial [Planctomycetota bacterium]|nr:hypothetical protein [Planctomycetota bacterium]